jgi:putative PIN family toxin of toxin-antitoxin system
MKFFGKYLGLVWQMSALTSFLTRRLSIRRRWDMCGQHESDIKMTALACSASFRVVLDTNVVIDLWHFRDARALRLDALIRERGAGYCTDDECFAELERVCAYPAFGLAVEARAALTESYRRRTVFCPPDEPECAHPALRCRDPDDLKFLTLAVRCGAALLVTRDKALLALDRRLPGCAILDVDAACDFLEQDRTT